MGNKENPYEPISLGLSKEEEVQQHAEVGENLEIGEQFQEKDQSFSFRYIKFQMSMRNSSEDIGWVYECIIQESHLSWGNKFGLHWFINTILKVLNWLR